MAQHLRRKFRPTLFIFFGTAGAQIREYLSPHYYKTYQRQLQDPPVPSDAHLLSYLDERLHDSIAMLEVTTEGPNADPYTAIAYPIMREFPDDKDMPTGAGELEAMIQKALHSVRLARRIDRIRNADYSTAETRTQVFIVGEANTDNKPWLAATLKIVRKCALELKIELPICYVINNYDTKGDYTDSLIRPSPISPISMRWSGFDVTNFGFVYEQEIPFPAPMSLMPESVRYATAETLMALASSDILSLPVLENMLKITPVMENYASHVGSLSTSMVRFPRTSVSRFCATLLAHDIVQKWRDDIDLNTMSSEQRRTIKEEGEQYVENIKGWLASDDPDGDVPPQPTFEMLQQDFQLAGVKQPVDTQQDAYDQQERRTNALFDIFSYDNVMQAFRRRKDHTQNWVDFLKERTGEASGLYGQWIQTSDHTWSVMNACINDHFTYQLDSRWSSSAQGFRIARVFVDQVDDRLAELAIEVDEQVMEHGKAYTAKITDYDRRSQENGQGKWLDSAEQPTIIHANQPGQVKPPTRARPSLGGRGGGLQLPSSEEQLAHILRERAIWKQNQQPSTTAIGSIGLFTCATMVFAASSFNLSLPSLMTASVVLASSGAAVHVREQRRDYKIARKDVLDFYKCYYDNLCVCYEDTKRREAIQMMRARIAPIRRRLDEMDRFLEERAEAANNDANMTNRNLFRSPSAERDVFVADGERLEEQGTHTLTSIAAKVGQRRQNNPTVYWHRTLDRIKDMMVQELQNGNRSLMDMNETEFQNHLYDFTQPIIDTYLQDELVDITVALDKPDVWDNVLEQARRPLYSAHTGVRNPDIMFVMGNEQALRRSERFIAKREELLIRSNEWLIVAGLFHGGTPHAFDAKALFPPK